MPGWCSVAGMTKRRALTKRRQDQSIRRVAGLRAAGRSTDDVFGIRLEAVERGVNRGRLRWSVDREPVYALAALARLRSVLDALEVELVQELRADLVPWDDIGALAGISGEGARKRFARLVEESGS